MVGHGGIAPALVLSALLKENASLRSHELYILQSYHYSGGASTVRG